MADPAATVPYHDPYDASFGDEILDFIRYSNPTLFDVSTTTEEGEVLPLLNPSSVPAPTDQIADSDNPLDDPIMWEFHGEPDIAGSSQAGSLRNYGGETSNQRRENWQPRNFGLDYGNNNNSQTLVSWPPSPVPFGCSCCQVLREIIHTNGRDVTKLEIHGRLGLICHAILDIHPSASSGSQGHHYEMWDFCKKSMDDVKQLLVQYCFERKQEGFVIVQDPLSVFYHALCVGFDWEENLNMGEFVPPPSSNRGAKTNQPNTDNNSSCVPKTSLAAQRERTGKLTIKDVGPYFHLPIEEAAKKMNLCPTVMKRICRRAGLSRWPHRKIKSIERKISDCTQDLSSNDAEIRARAQADIEKLQKQIDNIRTGDA